MQAEQASYFAQKDDPAPISAHREALMRCVKRLHESRIIAGVRNPKVGKEGNRWSYCKGYDWVMGFYSGQLWLAYQLTGDPALREAAQSRRSQFRAVLEDRKARDHDIGFLFSLHSVADWQLTGDKEARDMGLEAARSLLGRFREEGGYIQAWTPRGPHDREQARFANGRMIADTMQNLALLHWAHRETGVRDFYDVATIHADTTRRHLVRKDATSFHTFLFDPASGEPLRGETHQGYSDDSCWARGQSWLIHGFANGYAATGDSRSLDSARAVADKAMSLMGETSVPVWDFSLPADGSHPIDSSAGAVMSAGMYLLADLTDGEESEKWRTHARRLLDGLLEQCDLTGTPGAEGLLAHGAAFVPAGRSDAMLPYGDYYFMEALMRSLGHRQFFW
ncbi:glycoside hydrolase family 88 protein [Marinimicrobium sp. ARAG 43.8]|uniref:glycoside hydrolase family 88 protein n=1 Tax=Marinimicrobium sp. ARAG 43.8 TaxID=3418719 RepID=UPI003CEB4CA8